MKEPEWLDTIAIPCDFKIVVHGGAMCKMDKTDYCDFKRCPRLKKDRN